MPEDVSNNPLVGEQSYLNLRAKYDKAFTYNVDKSITFLHDMLGMIHDT